jgi:hypothetical protein
VLLSVFLLLFLDIGGGGATVWCRRRSGFFSVLVLMQAGCLQGEKVDGWVIGVDCFVRYSAAALVWW